MKPLGAMQLLVFSFKPVTKDLLIKPNPNTYAKAGKLSMWIKSKHDKFSVVQQSYILQVPYKNLKIGVHSFRYTRLLGKWNPN